MEISPVSNNYIGLANKAGNYPVPAKKAMNHPGNFKEITQLGNGPKSYGPPREY